MSDTAALMLKFLDRLRVDLSENLPEACSFMHLKALDAVSRLGSPSMSELASSLKVTSAGSTLIVDRLVETGQLTRIHDEDDRRVVRLKLSAKGRSVLEKGMRRVSERLAERLSSLSKDDQERLASILTALIQE